MKKALITGISGFVGSHLANYLTSQDIAVFGISHPSQKSNGVIKIRKKSVIYKCDILNKRNLKQVLGTEQFDLIFHLAAFSSPTQSILNPLETLENNIIGQVNLLEVLSEMKSYAKILIVGSSEEYGSVDEKNSPVNESTPLSPNTPYSISKLTQDFTGFYYYLHRNLNIVRVRPFNHIGPGQSTNFVVPALAAQIAKVSKGRLEIIKVGNLDSWRDFTDVRDICRAYLLSLEKGKKGEVYNLGSGNSYKIADILERLIGFSKMNIEVVADEKLIREGDTKKIVCDFSKFNKVTGWKPEIPIDITLFDTLKYEIAKLNN